MSPQILLPHTSNCVFLQIEAKSDAESSGQQSISLMATAPALTPSKSWCALVSVSQLKCFRTGLAAPTAGSSGVVGAAARTGGVSTTRPAPSASSCSARTAAQEHTKLPLSPPASARDIPGNTTNQATRWRSPLCRRRNSCTKTSPRARGGWGRRGWERTGTRQNPEAWQACRLRILDRISSYRDTTSRAVDYLCVTVGLDLGEAGSSLPWRTAKGQLNTFVVKHNATRTAELSGPLSIPTVCRRSCACLFIHLICRWESAAHTLNTNTSKTPNISRSCLFKYLYIHQILTCLLK